MDRKTSLISPLLASLAAAMLSMSAAHDADACTNVLISKGASADGSCMVSYAADSHTLFGELYFRPAASHEKGEMLKIYEWDTGNILARSLRCRILTRRSET